MEDIIDYFTLRNDTIELYNLYGVDDVYTFFYDETNNCRVFRITENGFNSSINEDFVLGGLVYKVRDKSINVDSLWQTLKLQPTLNEIKRKHIAPGSSFLECMESSKLQILFDWLVDNNIYIHYMILDNFYFGIVDIVDSLFDACGLPLFSMDYVNYLKSVLCKYMRRDKELIHNVFLKYHYPNINDNDVCYFCDELSRWIHNIEINDIDEEFALISLSQLFKESRNKKRLCFLANNTDDVLMESYEHIYMNSIYMFPYSQHIFDEETEIMKRIKVLSKKYNSKELQNYSFVKSTDNIFVQLSDVIVGIIGKLMFYCNTHSLEEISEGMSSLSFQQKHNIYLLNELIEKSSNQCNAFIHKSIGLYEQQKEYYIFTYIK